tara:strand:+ start:836 stop:2146 length:1311 start_codon:yes stop_codon:yes gene_type:complete
MSDIRFNQWLHQSGTGGVTQLSSGHVGIGTTNPLIPVHSGNNAVLNVGVVTANNIYAGTLNGTLALSDISGITGSFTSDLTVNGNLDTSDKIRHVGDTNTAIRFPANDTITFETGGYERLRIDSDGRFGVNTTNPDSTFRMDCAGSIRLGTGSYGSRLQFSRSGLGDELVIGVDGYGNSTSDEATIQSSINSPRPLVFATNNAERLRIHSSGAVMINTTNSSSRTLNLNGTFGILSTNQSGVIDMSVTDAGEASIGPYVAGGSSLILKTNSSGSGVAERLRISSAGYVTKPNHPSFCARHQASDGFSGDVIVLTRISTSWDVWNTGGHYSTSTGKFTVPVAGVYYFEGQVMSTGHSNGDNIQDMLSLESNRGRIAYCRQRESYFSSATNANGYYTNSVGSSARLDAGDTVWIQRHPSQNWSYSNRYYSYFTGWLIG